MVTGTIRTGTYIYAMLAAVVIMPAANGFEGTVEKRGILHTGLFGKKRVCEPIPYCPPEYMPTQPLQPTPKVEPKLEPVRPQQPQQPQPPTRPTQPAEPAEPARPEPAQPEAPAQQPPAAPDTSPFDGQDFASGLETAGGGSSLAPSMLGDFVGIIYRVPQNLVIDTAQEQARARILNRYKIADNTSPIPQTRLIYSYNYFSDAFNTTGSIHRHTFGAELAMLDNLVSVEVRQAIDGFRDFPDASDRTDPANFRAIFKGVMYRRPGVLVSAGLGIGFPTGENVEGTPDDNYVFTPFVGFLYRSPGSRWYAQGFEQIDLPTSDDDQVLLHTDIGIGYHLHEEVDGPSILPFVTAIIPTAELHLYTPIGDDPTGRLLGLVYQDVLNSTLGTVFFFGPSTSLSLGLGIPLSTQKDYDYEFQCHFQWRFGRSQGRAAVPFSG